MTPCNASLWDCYCVDCERLWAESMGLLFRRLAYRDHRPFAARGWVPCGPWRFQDSIQDWWAWFELR